MKECGKEERDSHGKVSNSCEIFIGRAKSKKTVLKIQAWTKC
jgi:hypothetical protein